MEDLNKASFVLKTTGLFHMQDLQTHTQHNSIAKVTGKLQQLKISAGHVLKESPLLPVELISSAL
jgi:hypothetical protein